MSRGLVSHLCTHCGPIYIFFVLPGFLALLAFCKKPECTSMAFSIRRLVYLTAIGSAIFVWSYVSLNFRNSESTGQGKVTDKLH